MNTKILKIFLLLIFITGVSFGENAHSKSSHVHVRGYTKHNGTRVNPYIRKSPSRRNYYVPRIHCVQNKSLYQVAIIDPYNIHCRECFIVIGKRNLLQGYKPDMGSSFYMQQDPLCPSCLKNSLKPSPFDTQELLNAEQLWVANALRLGWTMGEYGNYIIPPYSPESKEGYEGKINLEPIHFSSKKEISKQIAIKVNQYRTKENTRTVIKKTPFQYP